MRKAQRADLAAVLKIQRRAFGRVAAHYGVDSAMLPPVRETLDVLREMHDGGTTFLVAVSEGRIVGTVRAEAGPGDSVEIARLGVDDGWEGKGVGTALMRAVEAAFPSAPRFELFTGAEMAGAVSLYERLGYVIQRTENVAPGVELVWLAKTVAAP